ncbi:MAG: IPT/TIG domain-containing protein [Dehalococcoidia bacterium]|nr:IPT/TIG domain-containing protein [Dehalococcoidia bacterium]
MGRRRVRRGHSWRVVLVLAALAIVLGVVGQAKPERAVAAGAGVFALDKPEYFVQEGAAVGVTILRTEGTTLTNDVTVTLELEGGTVNEDYPASTITQLATFVKGSNPTQVTVFFQTLNQARISHNTGEIQIFLRSVSSGSIGTIDSAPLTIYGNGAPRVFSVSPRSASPGTTITVQGVNFITSGTTQTCVHEIFFEPEFGGVPPAPLGTFTVDAPNRLRFTLPAAGGLEPYTTYDVPYHIQVVTALDTSPDGSCVKDLSETGASLLTDDDTLVPVDPGDPTVIALTPKSGPTSGGTAVRLFGSNFDADVCSLGVMFGGVPAPSCVVVSATVVDVVTPAHAVGTFNVIVNNGSDTSPPTPENLFTFAGAPVITSVTPNLGPNTGGTSVTIVGSGFATPGGTITGVKFGGDNATTYTMVNNTTITAVSPVHLDGGTVQITVTHSLTGESGFTTAANFTYVVGPLVQNLSPNIGSPSGGTTVTISGVGFAPGAVVTFGGVNALFVFVRSQTQIEATSPPGTGNVQVIVTVGSTSSPVSPESEFTYSGPIVQNITPNAGPTAGGTKVLIEGNNFTQAAVVKFGQVDAAEMTYISPAMIEATAPASPNGFAEVHVTITTPSGTSATSEQSLFTYTDGPIVEGVNPQKGPLSGGTIVVITGKNFDNGAKVMFGATEALAFNFNSQTQVTALTPPVAEAGVVAVRVTTAVGISPVSELSEFLYESGPPVVAAVTPNTGTVFGGETVVISGRGFLGTQCPGGVIFGTAEVPSCTVINDTTMTIVTPAQPSGAAVVVVQTAYGSSEIVELFTYLKPGQTGPPDGGGGGGGSGGDDDGIPVPPTGNGISYTLQPTWTLIVWRGADEVPVRDALQSTSGQDLSAIVSAVYTYDRSQLRWIGYFTGAEDIPGANDFTVLSKDRVYWIATTVNVPVTWQTVDN